jgi:hypothetical protein
MAEVSPTPEFLEQYEMGELLGEGAMGTVHRAVQRSVGRAVAVKLLNIRQGEQVARFLREGRVLARISHPNVLRVFDCGEMNGHPYLVTELLSGGTLHDLLANGVPDWPLALRIGTACFEGLAACHDAGVIHRDLKPENILFDAARTPKISDLGLAADGQDAHALTATGVLLGTPLYMAPEQLREGRTGVRSDLWSMAAVVYQLLAGRPPVTANSLPDLVAAHGQPGPRLDELRPDVPPAACAALHRALEEREDARPESAAEMAAELALAASGAPAAASRPGMASRTGLRRGRSGGVSRPGMQKSSLRVSAPVAAPEVARPLWHIVAAALAGAVALGLMVASLTKRPAAPAGPAPPSPVASAAPRSLWIPVPADGHRVHTPAEFARSTPVACALSRDRRHLATLDRDGSTCVWDLAEKKAAAALDLPGAGARGVTFSPDGARIAISAGAGLFRWDWKDRTAPERLDFGGDGGFAAFVRGGALAIAREDGVWLAAATGIEPPRRLSLDTRGLSSFAASPDGQRVALGFRDGRLVIHDTVTRETARVNAHGLRPASRPAEVLEEPAAGSTIALDFSADGKRLASGGSEGHARVWEARTGRFEDTYTTNGNPVNAVALTPDGLALIVASGTPDRPFVGYWEVSSATIGAIGLISGSVLAVASSGSGAEVIAVMDEGVVSARASTLATQRSRVKPTIVMRFR